MIGERLKPIVLKKVWWGERTSQRLTGRDNTEKNSSRKVIFQRREEGEE